MHLLLAGSMIATLSAWAVTPSSDVFDSGLAGHFAAAMQQADQDCLASTLIVDGGSMLVILDERGDVTEIDLGSMPAMAAHELRAAIPASFSGAQTSITRDALMCSAMGAAEESEEVQVDVSVTNGSGEIVIEHNGVRKIIEIDLENLGSIDLDAIAEELGESGIDMHTMIGQMMSGDMTPGAEANVLIEVIGDGGENHHKRMHLGRDHDEQGREKMMMMFVGDEEGYWMSGPGGGHPGMESSKGCPMCGGMQGPGGMGSGGPRGMPSHGGMQQYQGMMGHPGMGGGHGDHEDSAANMLRQHMHFLAAMQEDPDLAWNIIESLPPEMRREHEEILHQLMDGDDRHDDNEFFERVGQFDEKLAVVNSAVRRLSDESAIAVFGVWQAREMFDPEARIGLLAPMMNDEGLIPAVRNAASFVVMEALADIGDAAGATESLGDMIRRNGKVN